jgi:four helix bundle protein
MSTAGSKAREMETRMVSFAADIMRISSKLPPTMDGKHIAPQILRSGTAAAANYGEARGAESRKDFIHKIRIVLKELNETAIWLQLIAKSSVLPPEMISRVLAENRELCGIMAASVKTARSALP